MYDLMSSWIFTDVCIQVFEHLTNRCTSGTEVQEYKHNSHQCIDFVMSQQTELRCLRAMTSFKDTMDDENAYTDAVQFVLWSFSTKKDFLRSIAVVLRKRIANVDDNISNNSICKPTRPHHEFTSSMTTLFHFRTERQTSKRVLRVLLYQ
jgi:hypothetical protein